MAAILALVVAWLFPLAFLYGVRTLDLYRTGRFHYNIHTILWGAVAYGLAVLINSTLLDSGLIPRQQMVRVAAPIVEEILKAAILLYLVRRADFNYVVDGAIYGFGAGIGFAIVENTEYILGRPDIALTLALSRVFSTNLIHATASGLIGSALAEARDDRTLRRPVTIGAGFILAGALHIGFNTMVSTGAFLIFAILAGALGAGFIILAIRLGLKVQKGWIEEKLGATDRVTRGEAEVVKRLHSLDEVLAPFVERFGPEKAATVEEFLVLQAQIGIKRKMAERAQEDRIRLAIETEIQKLGGLMEAARRRVGAYCMLFVRSIYREDTGSIWSMIERQVPAAGTGLAGGGLYSRLDARLSEAPGNEP